MRRQTSRNPLFHRRRFADDVIILCVRWYLRYRLSYRDMAEIVWELGVLVAPSMILRWVVHYADTSVGFGVPSRHRLAGRGAAMRPT